MPFDAVTLIAVGILFVGTLVRATLGFGNALITMPLLVLIMSPTRAAPVVALVALLSGVVILAEHRRNVHLASTWRFLVSAAVGIPIGVFGLVHLSSDVIHLVLGVVVLGFTTFQLVHPERAHLRGDSAAFAFGFVAGVLGGAYNTSGPPIVIYGTLRRWTTHQFRATLQGLFVPAGLMVVFWHGTQGLLTADVLRLWVVSLPTTILAFFLGRYLSRHLKPKPFVLAVHVFLLVMGASLVIRSVRSLWGG